MPNGYPFRINQFHRGLLILLIAAVGVLAACEKTALPEKAITGKSAFVQALRGEFISAGLEKSLNQPFDDTVQVHWEPDWSAAYTKASRKGVAYTYVPLHPQFQSIKTGQVLAGVKLEGAARFLLAKQGPDRKYFSLATYMAEPPAGPTPPLGNAQPIEFNSFSGVLTLHGLSVDEHARFVYKNGVLLPGLFRQSSKAGAASREVVCIYIYDCTWYAYCGPYDRYNARMAFTSDANACQPPGFEPCEDWGKNWELYETRMSQQCTYVDDPPPPGGGGGGESGPDLNSPCGQMATLAAKPGFQKANALAIQMSQAHNEMGLVYRNGGSADTDFQRFKTGAPNDADWPRVPGWQYDGMIHTHPGGLSVFSMSDISQMFQIADEGYMHDPATFTMMVYTSYGEDYALKIADYQKFLDFKPGFLFEDDVRAFERRFILAYPPVYPMIHSSSLMNEQSLLRILNDRNTGMILLKHDRATNTWQQRTLGANNTPINNPCQ